MGQLSLTTAVVQTRLDTVPTLSSTVSSHTTSIGTNGTNITNVTNRVNRLPIQSSVATSPVTGQNKAITNIDEFLVRNSSLTDTLIIGLGSSSGNAEAACTSGTDGVSKFTLLPETDIKIDPLSFTHYAWVIS